MIFRLYFLDLQGNPLSPHLQTAAGDCDSNHECQLAASRVLKFQAVYKQVKFYIIIFSKFLKNLISGSRKEKSRSC